MGYFEPDGERMRKVLCLRNDVRNVSYMLSWLGWSWMGSCGEIYRDSRVCTKEQIAMHKPCTHERGDESSFIALCLRTHLLRLLKSSIYLFFG